MHQVNAKGILSSKNGINLYRGCSHGCIYCDSRSKCYHMEHDFEDIEVKINGPELLEKALSGKRKKAMIGTGAMTDPYLHLESELELTRKCLEIIFRYDFGVVIQTKSSRILRDLDILKKINQKTKCVVAMTLTTFDEKLCKILEPNVSTTKERFEVLKIMKNNGIPTIVWMTPILPFINDTVENISGLLDYCIEAGVYGILDFGMGLTLRDGDREYYFKALDKYFPKMKERYMKTYGNNYVLPSPRAKELRKILRKRCSEEGIVTDINEIFAYMSKYENKLEEQLSFDLFV